MKIGITGYRKFNDYQLFTDSLFGLGISELISGGANGTDCLSKKYASENNIKFTEFLPLFKTDKSVKYHISHFHIRNRQIVDASDMIVAFLHPSSRGTKSTITYAQKKNVPVVIIPVS